jgi:hypothetical protein
VGVFLWWELWQFWGGVPVTGLTMGDPGVTVGVPVVGALAVVVGVPVTGRTLGDPGLSVGILW